MRYRQLAGFGWHGRRRSILGVRPDACALLTGVSLGAGLMYILDRESGKRRRQLAADKLGAWTRRSTCAVEAAATDAGNRLKGLAHEASRVLRRREPAVGSRLAAQIRARLGRIVSNPHAIDVSAGEDRVILEGRIPASEVDALLAEVKRVAGVAHVDDRLSRIEAAADDSGRTAGNGEGASAASAWEGS